MQQSNALRPSTDVWFDDGDFILASLHRLYRVHQNVLTKNSAVIASAIKDADVQELFQGIPMIHFPDIKDEEMVHFLKYIHGVERT